jgi:hypothetical protein
MVTSNIHFDRLGFVGPRRELTQSITLSLFLALYSSSPSNMRGDEEDDEMMEETVVNCAEIPNSFRELRACMTCSLVKTYTQFYESGCDNCIFLQMADNRSRVAECTSAYFEG